jgi:hypothetical protein
MKILFYTQPRLGHQQAKGAVMKIFFSRQRLGLISQTPIGSDKPLQAEVADKLITSIPGFIKEPPKAEERNSRREHREVDLAGGNIAARFDQALGPDGAWPLLVKWSEGGGEASRGSG